MYDRKCLSRCIHPRRMATLFLIGICCTLFVSEIKSYIPQKELQTLAIVPNFKQTPQQKGTSTTQKEMPSGVHLVEDKPTLQQKRASTPPKEPQRGAFFRDYKEALETTADAKNQIILTIVDYGYLDMAKNFYENSILPHGIQNFLVACEKYATCNALRNLGMDVYFHPELKVGKAGQASNFNSNEFNKKTQKVLKLILSGLQMGFTILAVDVDIIFFKNPLEDLHCPECDILFQADNKLICTGFYLIRNTTQTIDLFKESVALTERGAEGHDQKIVNFAAKKFPKLVKKALDPNKYPNGRDYFKLGNRTFATDNPCHECMIVHNNWIIGHQAKVYRFKENLMWSVDENGYYSDPDAKYLTYDNPLHFGKETIEKEITALFNAFNIAHILNRIVVLPSFHCHGRVSAKGNNRCSLLAHFNVEAFDFYFKGKYREHMFLKHAKVPDSVKLSVTAPILMDSVESGGTSQVLLPLDIQNTPDEDTVRKRLQSYENYSVLYFNSLYGHWNWSNGKPCDFSNRLEHAFNNSERIRRENKTMPPYPYECKDL